MEAGGWSRRSRKTVVRSWPPSTLVLALPPMINLRVFVPWDLTFGSGGQTLGALLSVITVGWVIRRSDALRELASEGGDAPPVWLFYWLPTSSPLLIVLVGVWWVLTDLLGLVGVE